jgi:uncharacterized protein involved in type VI secretion and phage assembly
MNGQGPPFYGKYRGVVTANNDTLFLGRIRATVQDVLGPNESGWAMPSLPFAGQGVGLFLLPPVGASVWIEFEHGDPEYPIWSGCFWATGEPPAMPAVAAKKVLKTDIGTITLDDTPGAGGITIETQAGMKIVMNTQGIEINNGQGAVIKLSANQVNINNGALEVM